MKDLHDYIEYSRLVTFHNFELLTATIGQDWKSSIGIDQRQDRGEIDRSRFDEGFNYHMLVITGNLRTSPTTAKCTPFVTNGEAAKLKIRPEDRSTHHAHHIQEHNGK